MIEVNTEIKPYLRWAGGKTWLKKHIDNFVKIDDFSNYHEPFLGSASIYFHLNPRNDSYLSDINSKLINTYIAIKDDLTKVISELKKFKNTKEDYYSIRGKQYKSIWKQSAQFIYLNQTSFNGIYRENLNGIYNVPYGYRQKEIFSELNLIHIRDRLKNAVLFTGDFEIILNNVKKNDLVFLDPPYTVSHNHNGFIKYNKSLFSIQDQYRLKDIITEIESKGAFYILTNAAHDTIYNIFSKDSYLIKLARASLVGGKYASRGQVQEFMFTNIRLRNNFSQNHD